MKAPFFGKKNICKKPKIPPRKKDISFDRYKKRINTEVPEDLESRNSLFHAISPPLLLFHIKFDTDHFSALGSHLYGVVPLIADRKFSVLIKRERTAL